MSDDELFGLDGTQALQVDAPMSDPLGGLVTGAAFAPGDRPSENQSQESQHRVVVPDAPAAPDQGPLKAAVDKAMMAGPPTNPLRLPTLNFGQYVRPAPMVRASGSAPAPAQPMARRDNARQPVIEEEYSQDYSDRKLGFALAGRVPRRRKHPVVSGLIRLVVGLAFVVLLLILVLHGSGSGGNLSGLFG